MPSFSSVDEYIAAQPAETQARLRELRAIIRQVVPDATEVIGQSSRALPAAQGRQRSSILGTWMRRMDDMEGFDPQRLWTVEATTPTIPEGMRSRPSRFLAQHAGQRDALEFAVGTGRIALPLMAAGVRVDGIELSMHTADRPAISISGITTETARASALPRRMRPLPLTTALPPRRLMPADDHEQV